MGATGGLSQQFRQLRQCRIQTIAPHVQKSYSKNLRCAPAGFAMLIGLNSFMLAAILQYQSRTFIKYFNYLALFTLVCQALAEQLR